MKTVVLRLYGGLGNQLFQYAYLFELYKRGKTNCYIDIYSYDQAQNNSIEKKEEIRSALITCFNISIPLCSNFRSSWFFGYSGKNLFARVFFKVFRICFPVHRVKQNNHQLLEVLGDKKRIGISGRFQSFKYFEKVKDKLTSEFEVVPPVNGIVEDLLSKLQVKENFVAVHIRGKDYVYNKFYQENLGCLGLQYYHDAFAIIEKNIENPVFFIFTDDKNYVQTAYSSIFLKREVSFIDDFLDIKNHYRDVVEFMLMASFPSKIISNSTFALWTIIINGNYRNYVNIVPLSWSKNPDLSDDNIFPQGVIKVESNF